MAHQSCFWFYLTFSRASETLGSQQDVAVVIRVLLVLAGSSNKGPFPQYDLINRKYHYFGVVAKLPNL